MLPPTYTKLILKTTNYIDYTTIYFTYRYYYTDSNEYFCNDKILYEMLFY